MTGLVKVKKNEFLEVVAISTASVVRKANALSLRRSGLLMFVTRATVRRSW
jgi:hypothetical protein